MVENLHRLCLERGVHKAHPGLDDPWGSSWLPLTRLVGVTLYVSFKV